MVHVAQAPVGATHLCGTMRVLSPLTGLEFERILQSHGLRRGLGSFAPAGLPDYSHSIGAGGLDEMSYTTRLTPLISLMIRLEMRARTS